MKSLVIERTGNCAVREAAAPTVGPDDVLLAANYVGLCGSDLNTYNGLNPLVSLPRIPGHEIGGTIVARGENVSAEFEAGKRAIVIPYTTCGTCTSCRKGRVNACKFNKTLGVQQDGGMSAQIALNADKLILNQTLPLAHLALVEPLSVGFHAVARGRVTADDTVLVLGGGMIGVGAILGAKAIGARVIVSEVSQHKTATLKSLGVEGLINPNDDDMQERLDELTDGAGPDVIIEAVGLPATFRAAVDLAPFSGRVVYVGYAKSEVSYNTSLFNLKELDILGSRNATRDDFENVIKFLEGNDDVADKLITTVFPWSEAEHALDHWNSHRDETFKIMIDIGNS